MVEVNPRLAGGMIPRLVEEATGVDLIALLVARVAGDRPAPVATRARARLDPLPGRRRRPGGWPASTA